jgi:ABC-type sugar transport system substrate-binding protein
VLVGGALAVGGCGGDSDGSSAGQGTSSKKAVKIGLSLPPTSNEFWRAVEAGARFEARRLGAEISVAATQEIQPAEAISDIKNQLTAGANAILTVAYDPGFKPTLDAALADKIPVVCVDSCIPGWNAYTSFVRTDNAKAGQIAGKYISELVKGSGAVSIVTCPVQYPSCNARQREARAVLKQTTGVKIFGPIGNQCDQAEGVKDVQNALTANRAMKVLYGTCGQIALAADKVAEQNGSSFDVVGVDGAKEELAAIRDGRQKATVAQFPIKMGQLGVRQLVAAVRGEKVTKDIDSGAELVTAENVADFIAENSEPR